MCMKNPRTTDKMKSIPVSQIPSSSMSSFIDNSNVGQVEYTKNEGEDEPYKNKPGIKAIGVYFGNDAATAYLDDGSARLLVKSQPVYGSELPPPVTYSPRSSRLRPLVLSMGVIIFALVVVILYLLNACKTTSSHV
ncbi:uncharacterized protein PRCAT00002585001 [Priceomyces carsonii]|uniref:uncharacterized protein n=1 Tax=Priceomyces carsonii TaxID=28549 RepID=UPI002ED8494E|nr:unnamed protein product [Priceomyces carsonii]